MKTFQSGRSSVLVLVIVFLVVVLGGRYLFNATQQPVPSLEETLGPAGTSTVATPEVVSPQQATSAASRDESVRTTDTCAEAIRADLAKNKQTYAKGQMLVTFTASTTYPQAKEVLSVYGLVIQNEIDSQSSFNTRRLVTAAVAPGQEITKVCQLRSDTHVKFAGLDMYFTLHQ